MREMEQPWFQARLKIFWLWSACQSLRDAGPESQAQKRHVHSFRRCFVSLCLTPFGSTPNLQPRGRNGQKAHEVHFRNGRCCFVDWQRLGCGVHGSAARGPWP